MLWNFYLNLQWHIDCWSFWGRNMWRIKCSMLHCSQIKACLEKLRCWYDYMCNPERDNMIKRFIVFFFTNLPYYSFMVNFYIDNYILYNMYCHILQHVLCLIVIRTENCGVFVHANTELLTLIFETDWGTDFG